MMRVLLPTAALGLAFGLMVVGGGLVMRAATPENSAVTLPQFAAIDPPSGVAEAYVVRPPMSIAFDGTRTIRLASNDAREERLLVIGPEQRTTRLAAILNLFHG